jgi:hypothetical protein
MPEVTFGYKTGETLTYGAYEEDGTVRTAAGTSLPEEGSTGYYHATDANVDVGDVIIVRDANSNEVGFGVYRDVINETTIIGNIADQVIYEYDERT